MFRQGDKVTLHNGGRVMTVELVRICEGTVFVEVAWLDDCQRPCRASYTPALLRRSRAN